MIPHLQSTTADGPELWLIYRILHLRRSVHFLKSHESECMINKKNVLLKCCRCGASHTSNMFARSSRALEKASKLVCLNCSRKCSICGIRKGQDQFLDSDSSQVCRSCQKTKDRAEGNLYYRFPMLQYKHCPFSADKMADLLRETENSDSSDDGSVESFRNTDLMIERQRPTVANRRLPSSAAPVSKKGNSP
jgi:hypothetical protein